MEVKRDIALTKRSLEDLKKDVIQTKKDIGDGVDKAFAKVVNSKVFAKLQPTMYNKERKQDMKNIQRIVELMKTFPRHNDGTYEIPGRYIDDILKRVKNVESTL